MFTKKAIFFRGLECQISCKQMASSSIHRSTSTISSAKRKCDLAQVLEME